MSTLAAAYRKMVAAGMSTEDIADMLAILEAGLANSASENRSKGAERTRRWRDRKAATASQSVTERHETSPSDERHRASQSVTERHSVTLPHARVLDNLLDSTPLDGSAVVVSLADAWPRGNASDHAKALCLIANSPRLDLAKAPGLITTAGRLAAWQREGASWAIDVVPTVQALTRKTGPPIQSWKFFDAAVAQSIADNRQALEIPEHGRRQKPQPSDARQRREANHARAFAAAQRAVGET